MLRNPTSSLAELEKVATTLLREALEDQKKQIRRLGVRVSELSDAVGQIRMDSYF
jgi:nucleotidyltransferase/DNA polymerase involved in DNA repair